MTNDAAAMLVASLDLPAFAPVLARVGGVVSFFPLLGADLIPVRFRIVLAVALAWVLRPIVPAAAAAAAGGASAASGLHTASGAGGFAGLIAGELLVGALLGFSAQVAIAAFEAAGQFVGFQMGLTLSGIIDPVNGEQASAISVFYRLVALVLYFSIGAHHAFLFAIRDSYAWVGPGLAVPGSGLAPLLARITGGLFVLALRIAAPALVVAIVIDVALLLAARALPQVNLLMLGYPVKIALGLLAIASGLVVTPRLAAESLRIATDQAHALAAALAPAH